MKKILICTSIPYVNGKPHMGHALEYTQADALARFYTLMGFDVFVTAGTDENAIKNVEAAQKAGEPVADFVQKHSKGFHDFLDSYHISISDFIRTSTEEKHLKGSQKLWELCKKDIYLKKYEGLYCTGCEMFYKDGEFENNICPNHNRPLELVVEENYFFALSKYQKQLHDLIASDTVKISPEFRKNEILAFIDRGLEDFSVSRPTTRTKNWGIPVPGDDSQNMYVWFDALTNYITILDFDTDGERFNKYWLENENKIQIIGKDIIRFHAVYWVAMLLSANLPLPNTLFVHGFITVEGKKMSKSLGNVIDPTELLEQYGLDPIRYYLLREIPSLDDGDFSHTRMLQLYNNDLANELGNLILRITTLAQKDGLSYEPKKDSVYDEAIAKHIESYQFNLALELLWLQIKALNKAIDEFAPWKKTADERKEFLEESLEKIHRVGHLLRPFLPETSDKIHASVHGKIAKVAPLFPKKG